MKIISVLTEKDIRPNQTPTPESNYVAPRQATRVVIFDNEGCVALGVAESANGKWFSMIGGGIDGDESVEEGLFREALEEAGCKIKNIQELGIIEERGIGSESKGRCIQTNYCFVADVDGEKGEPQYTQQDINDGLELVWLPLVEAISNLKSQEDGFVTRKTLILLEEAQKVKQI